MSKRWVGILGVAVLGIGIYLASRSFRSTPDLGVDSAGLSKATVVIETLHGPIKFKFYPEQAPKTVNRLVELIGAGFYNGLKFDRVLPGLAIQAGDPVGDGRTGTGQRIENEISALRHREGTLSMAHMGGKETGDCIFQITFGENQYLDGRYTIFGQVIDGMDVVRKIAPGDLMKRVVFE